MRKLTVAIASLFALCSSLAACNSGTTSIPFFSPQRLFVSRATSEGSGNVLLAAYQLPISAASTPVLTMTAKANVGTNFPQDLAFDASGDLFVMGNDVPVLLSKLPAGLTSSSTPLGTLQPPNFITHNYYAVAVDHFGNVWIADSTDGHIYEYASNFTGAVTAPTALNTLTATNSPFSLAFDAAGDLFVGESPNAIERFDAASGVISNGKTVTATLKPGTNAEVNGLAFDAAGNLYYGDVVNNLIGRFNSGNQGNAATPDIKDTNAAITLPQQLAFDRAGNLYVPVCDGANLIIELPLASQAFSASLAPSVILPAGTPSCDHGIAVF